jgi:O-antigen biosynthesis protein WbqV
MKASTISVLIFFVVMFWLDRLENVPRSVPLIQWFILIVMLGGPRFFFRLNRNWQARNEGKAGKEKIARVPILLVGSGDGAALLIRSIESDPKALYRVVGILDTKAQNRGLQIQDIPVLGTLSELKKTITFLERQGNRPHRLVVTGKLDGEVIRNLVEQAEELKFVVSRLPSLTEFKEASTDGRIELKPIVLEDLLGRPPAVLDQTAIDTLIESRHVLVTGAGGTIGSELVRQICARRPASITLIDHAEFNLYAIDHEIASEYQELERHTLLCDIRDRDRVIQIFEEQRPELVFHAAALKHVPMVEHNPAEGIRTNVVGTRNVADAAFEIGVMAMVQISTDKAVNPTSMMGATKRLAEFYCQSLDLIAPETSDSNHPPRIMTVRFGNVLGSSGSVVPLFQKQLAKGGPLTVTHPEMRRYFMTVREAVELVLQASAHGVNHDDERGQIFVLDMGKPVKIVDVARQMIRLAGYEPDNQIGISFVGLRPGEKLYEELFDQAEKRLPARVSGVLAATSRPIALNVLQKAFADLDDACRTNDDQTIRDIILHVIPGYYGEAKAKETCDA